MGTLVRWAPFQELEPLERRMRSMFGDWGLAAPVTPAADLYETDDRYVLEMEVPGFKEGELKVELVDHMLTVKGERAEEKEQKEKTFFLHERLEKSFERRFAMPDEADTGKLEAAFKDGVLKVYAPRTKTAPPKMIEISKN